MLIMGRMQNKSDYKEHDQGLPYLRRPLTLYKCVFFKKQLFSLTDTIIIYTSFWEDEEIKL